VNDYGRSYAGSTLAGLIPFANGDFLIRALVEQISAPTPRPVGGIALPTNKLTIPAPYLALIGLVGTVTVAVATTRRRKPQQAHLFFFKLLFTWRALARRVRKKEKKFLSKGV